MRDVELLTILTFILCLSLLCHPFFPRLFPSDVTSSLTGINSFNHNATVSNVMVNSATNAYIQIPATVTLENPSGEYMKLFISKAPDLSRF